MLSGGPATLSSSTRPDSSRETERPTGLLFDQLSLNHGGAFNANDRMFVSNVTILKNDKR